jgi:sec-independent protein translocase protein TatA
VTALFEKPAFWVVILIVLLLFGAKRLPDLARGLGRSARILKAETEGLKDATKDGYDAEAPKAAAATPAVESAPAPAVDPNAPRYLVDPITGEKVLAQPVQPPADGTPRA